MLFVGEAYQFKCYMNQLYALNMWGTTPGNNVNVNLYTSDSSYTQQWVIQEGNAASSYRLHCREDLDYVLDYYRGSSALGNADIYQKATTDPDRKDQEFRFVKCGQVGTYDVYYISLAANGKRLTAVSTTNGNSGKTSTSAGNVYFADPDNSNPLQKWCAVPKNMKYTGIRERVRSAPTSNSYVLVNNIPDATKSSGYDNNCVIHSDCGFVSGNFDQNDNDIALKSQLRQFYKKVYPSGTYISDSNLCYYLYGEDRFGVQNATDSFNMSTGQFHPGVDICGPDGAEIHALYSGTVVARNSDYGSISIYVPELDITTNYIHMKDVTQANKVTAGDVIGKQSNKSKETIGSHLHFEIFAGENRGISDVYNYLRTIMPYGYMDGARSIA